ncbi:hypothetical protein QYE76_061592 [Lolium multiflorum]|uniref:Retrotransposon gag domain-containing protein n=1 Tax=Lolium multiflorum TaxID=4521 RepID=A0AAD8W7M0_LOLMU|nr:hypothetical protein QYE76_061592 [Lolium multiflorum]
MVAANGQPINARSHIVNNQAWRARNRLNEHYMDEGPRDIEKYDTHIDPTVLIDSYSMEMGIQGYSELLATRYLPLMMDGLNRQWFNTLAPNNIVSWEEARAAFIQHFASAYTHATTIEDLDRCIQGPRESTRRWVQRCRWRREEPAAFTADRTEEDKEDPDSIQNTPVHEMDATHNTGSGKPSSPSSSRTRADDTSSEEDDCVILEVFDPIPISYAFCAMPVLDDPDRQVMEGTVPVYAKPGAPPASRTRKTPATDAGSSAAPPTKHWETLVAGPARDRKRTKAIPTLSGAPLQLNRSAPSRTGLPPQNTDQPHDNAEEEEEAPLLVPSCDDPTYHCMV